MVSRHDYMGFGEEVSAGYANRSQAGGYDTVDGIRQQFTGHERDHESGLDYAQARYYNSRHGRFTSVDPLTASAAIRNPQTFNRYSYVTNSPYKFTDPLGLFGICPGGGQGVAVECRWGIIVGHRLAPDRRSQRRRHRSTQRQRQPNQTRPKRRPLLPSASARLKRLRVAGYFRQPL